MWPDDVNDWADYIEPAGNRMSVACLALGDLESRVACVLDEHDSVLLAARCADTAELLAACSARRIDVAIISSQVPGFDRNLVTALHGAGVCVIAINDPLDQYSVARLEALGVQHWVSEDEVEESIIDSVDSVKSRLSTSTEETSAEETQIAGLTVEGENLGSSARMRDYRAHATGEPTRTLSEGQGSGPSSKASGRSLERRTGEGERRDGSIALDATVEVPAHRSALRNLKTIWRTRRKGTGAIPNPPDTGGSGTGHGIDANSEQRLGHVVAVAGPHGAPGRSTIASSIVTQVPGAKVLLVDADTVAPCQSQHFGMLEESSGLAFACRAANLGALSGSELLKVCDHVSAKVKLLSGLPRTERWPEITHASLERLMRVARENFDLIVVDVGSSFECEDAARFDPYVPSRNMATRSVLECADLAVLVGTPDPVGLKRFISYTEDFRQEFGHTVPTLTVMNKAQPGALRSGENQVAHILDRYLGIDEYVSVPFDREVVNRAVHQARSVGELSKTSEIAKRLSLVARKVAEAVKVETEGNAP